MKFKLTTSESFYTKQQMEELLPLGFKFKKLDTIHTHNKRRYHLPNWHDEMPSIEINSLDELHSFADKYGPIIIDGNTIEIYNDYRE